VFEETALKTRSFWEIVSVILQELVIMTVFLVRISVNKEIK